MQLAMQRRGAAGMAAVGLCRGTDTLASQCSSAPQQAI